MSLDDLSGLINELTELYFPESTPERRSEFSAQLTERLTKQKRRRTFSINSDKDQEVKDAEIASDQDTSSSNKSCQQSISKEVSFVDDDNEILAQLASGKLMHRNLEKQCDSLQAVSVRRKYLRQFAGLDLDGLPFRDYSYEHVNGACCENLIGYIPMPAGIAGPINVNGEQFYVPMATTEGALVASTNRGCKALVNGVTSIIFKDGMTRAPVLEFASINDSKAFQEWIENPEVFKKVKTSFEETSRFCKLVSIKTRNSGRSIFLRFKASTGDAMGMNMTSKATSAALDYIKRHYRGKFKVISLSGNMCVDKKASAMNWIEGRGKSVIAEAIVPSETVQTVLKCSSTSLVELAKAKLHVGSSAAVSIGGSNAHAANIVAAMFIATGQDAAQVVSSSMCATDISLIDGKDLRITCTMNCLEIGTVGGGTILGPQHAMLKMLGCAGSHKEPGKNARRLAEIICATVLAGELSLLAAQCSGDLVRSHMKLNRSDIFKPKPQKCIEDAARKFILPSVSEKSIRKLSSYNGKSNSCMRIL